MPSPVSHERHSRPHARLITWLGCFEARTPGVDIGDNATVRLDLDNEPQPDAFLRVLPECRGQSATVDGFVEGAPELVGEIAASSASYDLHDKLHAYRRNGVREYLVWRVDDGEIDWFALRRGAYERLAPDPAGLLRSEVFGGLRLDVPALLRNDLGAVLAAVDAGCRSAEHAGLVARLAAGRR